MRKVAVSAALVAAMVSAFAVTPARAASAYKITAIASLPTFPCAGSCTGTLTAASVEQVGGGTASLAPGTWTFTYNEPTCAQGNASGSFDVTDGSTTTTVSFIYTRIGATAAVSGTIGSAPFNAVLAFHVVSPGAAGLAAQCAGTAIGGADVDVSGAAATA